MTAAHEFEIEKRRTLVEQFYLKGASQREIVHRIRRLDFDGLRHVSQQTVCRDILAIREEWKEQRILDFDFEQERNLRGYDQLADEAWRAWEVSKGVRKVSTREVVKDAAGKPSKEKTTNREEPLPGDSRFLDVVRDCLKGREAVLGLHAPKTKNLRIEELKRRLAAVLSTDPDQLPE